MLVKETDGGLLIPVTPPKANHRPEPLSLEYDGPKRESVAEIFKDLYNEVYKNGIFPSKEDSLLHDIRCDLVRDLACKFLGPDWECEILC